MKALSKSHLAIIRRAWEIAFMRHAHDLVHQSKSRGDFGRSREERDDALHISDFFRRVPIVGDKWRRLSSRSALA
jgi:hypothetical protein